MGANILFSDTTDSEILYVFDYAFLSRLQVWPYRKSSQLLYLHFDTLETSLKPFQNSSLLEVVLDDEENIESVETYQWESAQSLLPIESMS